MTKPAPTAEATLHDEHEAQLGLVSELEDALDSGADDAAVQELVGRFVATTKIHFMSEQLVMRQHGYPQYGAHTHEHDRLLEELQKFEKGFTGSQTLEGRRALVGGLREWLVRHIGVMDRRFEAYVAEGTADGGRKTQE